MKMSLTSELKLKMEGHVLITDKETGEVLVDKYNAIHNENMSIAIAKSLANKSDGPIYSMFFGNGGATVNGLGIITYLPPNTTGTAANLYNPTYYEVVDETRLAPDGNTMVVNHIQNALFSDIVITVELGFGEPAGQSSFDDATSMEQEFVFDEIGLKTFDVDPNAGLLLSHVIFHPVQKSLNRSIEVTYTIRIQMA
jgi:hypothetical protein